jgi:hypothetical protein
MKKMPLFSLPCPSTAAVHGPKLVDHERGLLVSLVCDDEGRERPLGVLFVKPRAFRIASMLELAFSGEPGGRRRLLTKSRYRPSYAVLGTI